MGNNNSGVMYVIVAAESDESLLSELLWIKYYKTM